MCRNTKDLVHCELELPIRDEIEEMRLGLDRDCNCVLELGRAAAVCGHGGNDPVRTEPHLGHQRRRGGGGSGGGGRGGGGGVSFAQRGSAAEPSTGPSARCGRVGASGRGLARGGGGGGGRGGGGGGLLLLLDKLGLSGGELLGLQSAAEGSEVGRPGGRGGGQTARGDGYAGVQGRPLETLSKTKQSKS